MIWGWRLLLFVLAVLLCSSASLHLGVSKKATGPRVTGLLMKQTTSGAPTVYFQPAPFLSVVQGAVDVYAKGFTVQKVGFYALLYTALDLLRDAERRNRLDGTTFKILQVSTSLTAMAALALEGPLNIKISNKLPLAAVLLQSLRATAEYGLPTLKISVSLKNLLATSFLVTMVPAIALARIHLPAVIPLLLGAQLALHGAATVGAKRLASTTYQKLNASLVLFFVTSSAATGKLATALWALPAVIGLWRGRTYKE